MSVLFSWQPLRASVPLGRDVNVPALLQGGFPRAASGTSAPLQQGDLVMYFIFIFFPAKGPISDHCSHLVFPLDL